MLLRRLVLAVLLCVAATGAFAAGGRARHVVVVVWEGMRPEFVNEKDTPTLWALGSRGVVFENQHPVFASLTAANGAALFTGAYPAHAGIVGDMEYRPEVDPLKPAPTEEFQTVRQGDQALRGRYIGVATLPEILRLHGRTTAVAGSKDVALLADRGKGPTVFAGRTLPENLLADLVKVQGDFPELVAEQPNRDDWTKRALVEAMWSKGVPDLSLLWLAEPELSQLRTGVGAAHSLAMIRNADQDLARVLRALDERQQLETTDILVVSDHGCSTISAVVDVADSLHAAGIEAHREFTTAPKRGDVLVVGNGGSVFVYVAGHDDAMVKRIVEFFQGWNRTGVIFTRKAMAGTFALAQIHNDAPGAPDALVSLRWTAEKNEAGAPGLVFSDVSNYGAGQGVYGSLSRFDQHSTMLAAGPDFRAGVVDHLPTGNVDLAPTILWILGSKPPKPMDGRVLTEALTMAGPKIKSYEPGRAEATATLEKTAWHQYLSFTEVNGVVYFDEGNGAQTAK